VEVSHDGKLHFIHHNFAGYVVVDYLVNRLTKGNNTSQQELAFVMEDNFLEEKIG
jgi:hypothetical protein